MMIDMKCTNECGLYTSQTVKTYLRFPTPASACTDWLVCQAEAVCAKTVYLSSCAICVYCIATLDTDKRGGPKDLLVRIAMWNIQTWWRTDKIKYS